MSAVIMSGVTEFDSTYPDGGQCPMFDVIERLEAIGLTKAEIEKIEPGVSTRFPKNAVVKMIKENIHRIAQHQFPALQYFIKNNTFQEVDSLCQFLLDLSVAQLKKLKAGELSRGLIKLIIKGRVHEIVELQLKGLQYFCRNKENKEAGDLMQMLLELSDCLFNFTERDVSITKRNVAMMEDHVKVLENSKWWPIWKEVQDQIKGCISVLKKKESPDPLIRNAEELIDNLNEGIAWLNAEWKDSKEQVEHHERQQSKGYVPFEFWNYMTIAARDWPEYIERFERIVAAVENVAMGNINLAEDKKTELLLLSDMMALREDAMKEDYQDKQFAAFRGVMNTAAKLVREWIDLRKNPKKPAAPLILSAGTTTPASAPIVAERTETKENKAEPAVVASTSASSRYATVSAAAYPAVVPNPQPVRLHAAMPGMPKPVATTRAPSKHVSFAAEKPEQKREKTPWWKREY